MGSTDEMVSARTCVDSGGCSMAIARPDLLDGELRCEPAVPAAGKVTITTKQMDAIQATVDKANAVGMRLTVADVISVLTFEDTGDPFDFQPVTDRDESMLGEARHKTVGGRGVVGRLIDKVTK